MSAPQSRRKGEIAIAEARSPAQNAAIAYISAGWRIVPVPHGKKSPIYADWPTKIWQESDIGPNDNVGVILGAVSGELCDVDLDSHWALQLAPYFLPPTLTYGHFSKPRSHWLYTCAGIRSRRIFFPRGDLTECVEIRAKNASSEQCGHQSVFPGSVHPSGEPICWDDDGPDEPAPVEAEELAWRVARLAVASLVCDGHDAGNQRNNRARAFAGTLCSNGWAHEDITSLFAAVYAVRVSDDHEQRRRDLDAVERTALAFARGDRITSINSLALTGLVSETYARVFTRIARSPSQIATEVQLARSAIGADIRERLIAEVRAADATELTEAADALAALAAAPVDADTRIGRVIDLRTPPKRLDFLCEGLGIAPGKISAIAGFGGVGKGPFLDVFALCAAAGKLFLGHHIRRSRVVLLDFETGPLLEWRLARLANGLGIDLATLHNEEWLTCVHARPPLDDDYLRLLETCVDRDSLVCIDSYTSATMAEQRDSAFANVAFALGSLSARRNATFLVVAHERKRQLGLNTADLERIAGHSAFSAAMQTAISLSRATDADANLIDVRCARSPIERFRSYQIRWEDVVDPEAPPAATVGEKARAKDWGLRVEIVPELTPDERRVTQTEELRASIARQEIVVLELIRAHHADMHVTTRELERNATSAQRLARQIAIRNLVQRGALRGNYHWRDAVALKKEVWLPTPIAEIGVAQD